MFLFNLKIEFRDKTVKGTDCFIRYRAPVRKLERIYLKEEAEGLMKERRGKACKESGTRKGRPPKLEKKVEEDLIAKNQRLRMEIEYLKRLSTLVLANEQKDGKKRL